jgi:hypothetical protein
MNNDLWKTISRWFYDTSTSAATGAARYGSFDGKSFDLLVVSSRWTRGFTWFRMTERNILRPQEN